MKAITLSNVQLSDFVRADAGNHEAKYDQRLAAMYTAFRAALIAGQKTPLIMVKAACDTYNSVKACRALTATPDKASPAASQAFKVYSAYRVALDESGIPGKLKGATVEQAEAEAEMLAACFVDTVTAALAPPVIDAKVAAARQAERDAVKAKKEADARAAAQAVEAAQAEAVRVKAEAMANASLPSLDEMALIIANAIRTGLLSAAAHNAIAEAAEAYDASTEQREEQAMAAGLREQVQHA